MTKLHKKLDFRRVYLLRESGTLLSELSLDSAMSFSLFTIPKVRSRRSSQSSVLYHAMLMN